MMAAKKLVSTVSVDLPDVTELGRLYQRAVAKDHKSTILTAEQTVLAVGRAQAAIAEARTLSAFLQEV
jgi:hypothetical protein